MNAKQHSYDVERVKRVFQIMKAYLDNDMFGLRKIISIIKTFSMQHQKPQKAFKEMSYKFKNDAINIFEPIIPEKKVTLESKGHT